MSKAIINIDNAVIVEIVKNSDVVAEITDKVIQKASRAIQSSIEETLEKHINSSVRGVLGLYGTSSKKVVDMIILALESVARNKVEKLMDSMLEHGEDALIAKITVLIAGRKDFYERLSDTMFLNHKEEILEYFYKRSTEKKGE